MTWWRRLIGRGDHEQRLGALGVDGWPIGGFTGAPGGVATPAAAEGLSAVLACVQLITSAMASLPASLEIDGEDGQRVPAPSSSPAWRIIRRPNRWQSWPAWMAWQTGQILMQGNGCSAIRLDGRGAPVALLPVPWPWLNPMITNTGAGDPRLVYDVVASGNEAALLGLPRRLLDDEVLHVRGRSDLGIIGRSVLSRAAAPIHEGIEIAKLADKNWRKSLQASGVIGLDGQLNDAGRERLKERLRSFREDANSVLILDQAAKFTAMSMTSIDAEFLGTRQFSVSEIARLFGVPENLIQIGTRTVDIPETVTLFAQSALRPLIELITSEFDEQVLPEGMHLAIDVDGLARGSFATMVAALASLKQSGIITANDGRGELGWPPRPDGDVLAVGPAPAWPADGPGSDHLGPSPGPTPSHGLKQPGSHEGEGSGRKGNGKANGAHAPGGSP